MLYLWKFKGEKAEVTCLVYEKLLFQLIECAKLVLQQFDKTYALSAIFLNSIRISLPRARACNLVIIIANKSSRLSSRSARVPALKKTCGKKIEVVKLDDMDSIIIFHEGNMLPWCDQFCKEQGQVRWWSKLSQLLSCCQQSWQLSWRPKFDNWKISFRFTVYSKLNIQIIRSRLFTAVWTLGIGVCWGILFGKYGYLQAHRYIWAGQWPSLKFDK